MISPPATSSVTPVIQDELSDARNSVAIPTSSGVPIRPHAHLQSPSKTLKLPAFSPVVLL
jgi:hypothetical protein